jgi:hypothetical protein
MQSVQPAFKQQQQAQQTPLSAAAKAAAVLIDADLNLKQSIVSEADEP